MKFLVERAAKRLWPRTYSLCSKRNGIVFVVSEEKRKKNPEFWDNMQSVLEDGSTFYHWLLCPCNITKGASNLAMLQRFKYLVTKGHDIRHIYHYNAVGLARILKGRTSLDSQI